jgi:asparagine synthetase B (glutamine-hydrolysing)
MELTHLLTILLCYLLTGQVRVPFLDKDMLDVTMELNPDYKLRIKVLDV